MKALPVRLFTGFEKGDTHALLLKQTGHLLSTNIHPEIDLPFGKYYNYEAYVYDCEQ